MILSVDLSFLNSIHFIFYLVLGLAILGGLIRGFKKTVYAFIVMAIFYILFFVTIDKVVAMLWTMDMPWLGPILGNIDPSLSNFTSFEDSVDTFINLIIGGTIAGSDSVVALATGLLQFVLKLVWTLLYFTVILIVWKILTWIIGAIFIKKKKGESKNPLFGALFGVANGLMAIFVTMIMLGGVMSLTESTLAILGDDSLTPLSFETRLDDFNGNQSIIEMANTTTSELDEYIPYLQSMVDEYNSDIFVKIASNIKTTSSINSTVEVPLNIDLFDKVLSFNYEDKQIGIRYEVSIFSSAAKIFLDSDYSTTNNISDITGDEIRSVFTNLSKSTLITSLIPVAIEVGTDYYDQTLPISLDELYQIDYEQELSNIGNISGALFDILNGAGFIGGEGSLSQLTVDGDTVRSIFGDMSDSEVIVLLTENILLPMLSDSEGDFSTIITVPDDLDVTAEITALGDIFAEIIDADIPFSDLEDADVGVLLQAASKVDLTILLNSQLVTEALINILSGETNVEGLDILTIPDNINWYDTYDLSGQLETPGELRNILEALNVLTSIASDVDLNNLDINTLIDMTDSDIEIFFDSYVLRATVSDIIKDTDLGDVPLVIPDSVYDSLGYFTKTELVNVVKSVKLILTSAGDDFDILQALSLTDTEIDTLLASDVIYATIGKEIYDLGSSSLIIPDNTLSTVLVDSSTQTVVNKLEIKNIFKALAVLDIQNFDSISFDATIINTLENSTHDDLDNAKINTLLGSSIVHATVSDMILDLDETNGGVLTIPTLDSLGSQVKYYDAANSLNMISKTEIGNVLKALYGINITDFDNIDLEDTSLLTDNMDVLVDSAIIHATVSKIMIDISGTIEIPEKSYDNQDVLIVSGSTTFISKDELINLMDALDVLGITNPSNFTSGFDLSVLNTQAKQDKVLSSAIVHATVSKTILDLNPAILYVPDQSEDGTALKIDRGTGGNVTTYVLPSELEAMIDVFNVLGLDLDQLNVSFTTSDLLDNSSLIVESSSLQGQISDRILNGSTDIIVPDLDNSSQNIKIVYADITYIKKTELLAFLNSVNQISGLNDFTTFSFNTSDLASLNLDNFFASNIMQATVSKFILDQSGTENPGGYGTTVLLVPTAKRESILVDAANREQIEKQELIYIIDALNILGMGNFDSGMDPTGITSKTASEIDEVLLSASFHITIDNMLRANANINSDIPALALVSGGDYGVDPLTTKTELRDFIVAMNTIGATDFQNDSISLNDIATLDANQRSTVLVSLIVRNKFTPDLESLANADPGYSFEASDYNADPVLPFLTQVAALDAVNYFYPLP